MTTPPITHGTWPTLLAVCILTCSGTRGAGDSDFTHPVMRVPRITAPTIDGRIGEEEWGRAGAFTGVTAEGSVGGHGSLVPEIQQVQWYLGYDDTFLYLAMRSPHPKGTYPVARVKENDLVERHAPILFEDHVEVQILSHGRRDLATKQGKGFYKIMANAKSAYIDEYLYNGTIGTEQLWSMGGPVKCHVTTDAWELEMAVEIGRLKVKKLDNRDLVMQLVRTDSCTGMYFAGWVGAPWLAWDSFPQVSFAPDTPACRFLKLGEIGAGRLDANLELVGGKTAAQVDVQVLVEDADGRTVHSETQTVSLDPGSKKTLSLQKEGLPISKVAVTDRQRRNHFELKVTARIGRKSLVLYHNRSPFMQFDDAFKEQFLDKWVAGRPQSGEWEYRVAYLPYSRKLEASVDLDFFGVPASVQTAREYRVAVSAERALKPLAQGSGTIVDLAGGPLLIDLPVLADGEYVARFELLNDAGVVVSTKKASFVRKRYEWEHNTLGMSEEVIPPFLPLEVKSGNSVRTLGKSHYTGRQIQDGIWMWGRIYSVAPNGLLEQIDTAPPTGTFGGARRLLAAPMRLEVTQGGKTFVGKGKGKTVESAALHRVDIGGRTQVGPVSADVKAVVEYDGWYEVEATLRAANDTPVESTDLVIDLDDQRGCPIDTLYVQRLGDGRNGNHFSAIPTKPGVHFKSTELMRYRGSRFDWKSFVPRTYVGNGDRGLWFFAWSADGWELRDTQPVIRIERLKNGDVRLRVRMLAGPVDLSEPRTVRFALQATPAKPNHPRHRTFNEEGLDAHDTRGYRYYGKSVDDFVNDQPEDYDALRKFVLYGMRHQGEEQRTHKKNYRWWRYGPKLFHGAKLIMYGSGQLTGMGPEEFRTFGGEWLGKSNWQPNRSSASDSGRWNYQGTAQWTRDEQVSVTGVNWTQSMIDFFIWYHRPLLEKSGVNGTWWDNSSIGTVREYNPERGCMEEQWLLYRRRQLIKRLHVLGWQLMRPPMWASNMHVDLGFAEVFWMVENDWYADGADMTSLDQWPVGQFRAMARTKSTMQVARPWLSHFQGTRPERDSRIKRSLWAMMMSHDIHPTALTHYKYQKDDHLELRRTLSRLRGLVNLPDTERCLFAGYWLTDGMVHCPAKGIHASVYSNASLRSAAILLFNGEAKGQYLAGTELDINALIPIKGKRLMASRIFDIETGEKVTTAFESGTYVIKDPCLAAGHGFRLLGIEAE
ncbi:MAG: hypothetical protein HN742_38690 [Lentisphaerae bacterium]|nr:hypothetical protein [Lentisphaerota bacterium]MBT5606410.1 hypothetical protein [Lentisphaerota bacterium]MBT7059738.1 hypothetical protein [Lentisphaerota bacterium]MBT7847858.1 hypothetical protein [Lentisphaerota bacterium]